MALSSIIPQYVLQAVPYSAEDSSFLNISDDASLRRQLVESWFNLPIAQLLQQQSKVFTLETGDLVEVRVERGASDVLVVLARKRQGLSPGWVQGSWIWYRNLSDGSL